MSSREIAELAGKRHDHVMRDITVMLTELHGVGGLPNFGDTYRNEQNGQLYPCFNLPKRETMVLVSGYSITLRARIIDRWMELEAAAAQPQPVAPAIPTPATPPSLSVNGRDNSPHYRGGGTIAPHIG